MNKGYKSPKELAIAAYKQGKTPVSYSQFNMYRTCPRQWKLTYIDKHKSFDANVFSIFGTAIHECLQHYLTVMYESSIKEANKLGLHQMMQAVLIREYNTEYEKTGVHFLTSDDLKECYYDGIEILDFFLKKRAKYFGKRNCKLIGIEVPILQPVESNDNVSFIGFVDIIMQEGDNVVLYDIKSSFYGWKPARKKIEGDQIRLYKEHYSKQLGIDANSILVEYFIVKRKLYENTDFPQSRIQQFRPAHGSVSMNRTKRKFNSFISTAFLETGKHNKEAEYPAWKTGCKFCAFKDNYELCPKGSRIKPESE